VSTVITGASRISQLQDNLKAVDVIAKLTPEVLARIDEITVPLAQ
jgi:aryl-alcohol dehydrogenase-like predicted oxidoreductase